MTCGPWGQIPAWPGSCSVGCLVRPRPSGLCPSCGTGFPSTDWLSPFSAHGSVTRASHAAHNSKVPIYLLPPGASHTLSQGLPPQACPGSSLYPSRSPGQTGPLQRVGPWVPWPQKGVIRPGRAKVLLVPLHPLTPHSSEACTLGILLEPFTSLRTLPGVPLAQLCMACLPPVQLRGHYPDTHTCRLQPLAWPDGQAAHSCTPSANASLACQAL